MSNKPPVVAGVDTHQDTHHVAVLTVTGVRVADRQFPASKVGYKQAADFMTSFGPLQRVGVEGTSSYGAGLARHLRERGIDVAEVVRPKRSVRRAKGKTDPIDAAEAAKAVLAGSDLPTPKTCDGPVESIRVVLAARDSAVKASTSAIRQIKSLITTAPDQIREQLRHLGNDHLIAKLTAVRPGQASDSVEAATWRALRSIARRRAALESEIEDLTGQLASLVNAANPALAAAFGFGTVTAAQMLVTAGDNPARLHSEAAFAALCGTAPLPASSGKTTRHRLNRGGDRQANKALHQVALVRMAKDPRTQNHIAKLTATGKSTPETMRCLKRAIAREAHHLIIHPAQVPSAADLRPLRLSLGITLEAAARHLQVWSAKLSRLERGTARNDTLTAAYRQWLTTQTAA
jgi:transposase